MKRINNSVFFTMAKIAITGGMLLLCQLPYAQAGEEGNKNDPKGKVRVIEEEGPEGHQTIGIDEASVSRKQGTKEMQLTFQTLMEWNYDEVKNPIPPSKVKNLNDREVRLIGFMYPLQEGKAIKYFCLLRTTQTCCYGPRPQYNQYVFVEMKDPTTFHRLAPVSCVGKFKVDPTPEEGFIFRLEGKVCESIKKK
jgi:hypothetical protein